MPSYYILSSGNFKAKVILDRLKKVLSNWRYTNKNYEYLFILGGDGTFVSNWVNLENVKVIGINAGNLGFYSSFSVKEVSKTMINKILKGDDFKKLNLLEVCYGNKKNIVLNEIAMHSFTSPPVKIYINDIFYQLCRSSGFVISTPTGSTGYAKSLNGSVIFPNLNCYEFIEVAPISHVNFLSVRNPLILPNNTSVEISGVEGYDFSFEIVLDGLHSKNEVFNSGSLKIKTILSKSLFLFPNNNKQYIEKLRKTFIIEK